MLGRHTTIGKRKPRKWALKSAEMGPPASAFCPRIMSDFIGVIGPRVLLSSFCLLATASCLLISGLPAQAQTKQQLDEARDRMVDEEIVAAGVKNRRVIRAMRDVPRHEFVPLNQRRYAYLDMALPIGHGQTISPPFVVAYMTEQINPQADDRVLEIGTGSGYQAAVLSGLVSEVYSIEIVETLGRRAAATLKSLKYANVRTRVGDGFKGWPERAPFDKIIVTCSPEAVPEALVEQLAEGGEMIVPVGERYRQTLYRFTKKEGRLVSQALLPTLFVPMTGAAEERRQALPNPLAPTLTNGGFEEFIDETNQAAGWHYQRQMEIVDGEKDAPSGRRFVTFTNLDPGRGSHALQGFAVDGRPVAELEVTLWIRGDKIRFGQTRDEWPRLVITFYDESRATVGEATMGPWQGSFPWHMETSRLSVPLSAREAIIRIGLLGGVGEISFDDLRMEAVDSERE